MAGDRAVEPCEIQIDLRLANVKETLTKKLGNNGIYQQLGTGKGSRKNKIIKKSRKHATPE